MAGKKIFIEYDIDSSDLKVANGETLSLTQQLRILKKELQRSDLKPEQFDILRKKIGDTEDQIAKTTVKSKDFFGVLSTLPGPVGAFGSSLLSVVDTLKVFSSFTFKDIKNSLTDVLDDIKEIGGFGNVKNDINDVGESSKKAASDVDDLGDTLTEVGAEAGATGGVVKSASSNIGNLTANLAEGTVKSKEFEDALKSLTKQGFDAQVDTIKNASGVITDQVISYEDLNGEVRILTVEQTKAAAAGKVLTNTTNGLVVAEQQATFWTSTLGKTIQGVLIATGIGIAIVLIGELIRLLYDYIFATNEAEVAQKKFADQLQRTNELLDLDLKSAKRRQDLRLAELKAQGATEEQIQKLSLDALKENLGLKQGALEEANALYSKTLRRDDEKSLEDLKAVGKRKTELEQEVLDLVNSIKIAELQDDIKLADKRREQQKSANDKRLADQREAEQKRIADTKTAEEQISQLIDEISLLRIKDERTRQFQVIENERKNQLKKIAQLDVDQKILDDLERQTRIKSKLKEQELTDKFNEEDLKLLKEFNRKKEDIEIAAIEDVRERENAERQINLKRQLEDLEEDKKFIELGEIEKEEVRKNIRKSFANEERQILKDDALKLLDDELRFLQIRQEAIRENTKAFFDSQRDILIASEKREVELAEGKEKELTAIKDKYAKLRKDIDEQEKLATLQAVGQTIHAISSLTAAIASSYDEEAKTSKDAFEKRKKLQIATATMSAASGIIQILAQPSTLPSPFDWIVKGINAAALGVTTAVQINNIKKTEFEDAGGTTRQAGTVRGMANGGIVRGPGGPKSDSIPTNLSNGEAVMTSGAVTMFAPLLSMMNQMGGGTSFSSDLSVASPDNPIRNNPAQEQSPIIMKTYVVESELTSAQQKQGRLKELSTL
jgi:hypothetical protein